MKIFDLFIFQTQLRQARAFLQLLLDFGGSEASGFHLNYTNGEFPQFTDDNVIAQLAAKIALLNVLVAIDYYSLVWANFSEVERAALLWRASIDYAFLYIVRNQI